MSTSIRSAIDEGARALDAAGIGEARKEAASLMSFALEADRAFVIAHAGDELDELRLQTFRSLITRRTRREPLQYLTGHQEFFSNVLLKVHINGHRTSCFIAADGIYKTRKYLGTGSGS